MRDRPSATALLIAGSLSLLARDPRLSRTVSPEAAAASDWFVKAASPWGRLWVRLAERQWFRALVFALERRVLPGIMLHYALRKRYLEEQAREALARGVEQVVILGAGFDTLTLRLHLLYPEVRFIEVDHPATQRVKQAALAAHGSHGPNLSLVPADLRAHAPETVLRPATGFRPGGRTLFDAEGLLMYLETEEVRALLQTAARLGGPGSAFAFTFVERRPDGRIGFQGAGSGLVDLWLRWQSEPFRWGIAREELPGWLERSGFHLRALADATTLRERYLAGTAPGRQLLAEGEVLAVAARLAA